MKKFINVYIKSDYDIVILRLSNIYALRDL